MKESNIRRTLFGTAGLSHFVRGHRALLAASTVGLVAIASHAQAQTHSHLCGCAGCAGSSSATEGSDSNVEFFRVSDRWSANRNAAGFTGSRGDAITLTYGVVPDGTSIGGTAVSGENAADTSNLIAFLNANIGTSSVWLPLIDDAYQRWGEISGLTMVRENNDDGVTMGAGGSLGSTGVRADMRIGGRFLDGQSGSNVLAYNYFPDNGDHVVDTGNTNFYSNSTNNYRGFRNVFMHEAGHGLGFSHFESNNSNGLMEPSINTSFDGPQHDDILAAQRNYGDAWEKNGGNDSTGTATSMGTFTGAAQTSSIGTDASDSTVLVGANDVDFISIDGTSDTDVFSFTLSGGAGFNVSLLLDPKGPTYNEGAQNQSQTALNTKALVDLELELLDSGGSVLLAADANGTGLGETISTVLAAGDYYARVSSANGAADNVQMYQLDISAEFVPEPSSLALIGLGGLLLARRRR
ncbi:MAG: matrixin family metalloprotease [Phycisphaeraceae bacterium]